MADAVRIPVDAARCPWCGSRVGGWTVGAQAVCMAGSDAEVRLQDSPTCPMNWCGGLVEEHGGALYLRLDDTRDIIAHGLRRRLDVADMRAEQDEDVIAALRGQAIPHRHAEYLTARTQTLTIQRDHWRTTALAAQAAVAVWEAEATGALRDVDRLSALAVERDRRLRICIGIGGAMQVAGLCLAAWWPTDPSALACVTMVFGGAAVAAVGGWDAIRRGLGASEGGA